MKSIRIEQYGGPHVLLRRDIPIPMPGEGEVLVRVFHAGINFMDVHTRQGKYANSRTYKVGLPCTLGMEGAGVVVESGPHVDTVKPGDRVAWCIAWGSYAEYAVVPVSRLATVPAEVSLDTAAAVMFHGCTAHYLAHDVGQLHHGKSCVILAASGGIGQLLIQLAKQSGARVIAVTSTDDKAELVRACGADHVCLYNGDGFINDVLEMTDGRGADVVFDPIGKATLRHSCRVTRTRGLVVNFGAVSGALTDLDPLELGEGGSLFLTRPRLADHIPDHETVQRRARDIFSAIMNNELQVNIGTRYTFDNVEEAHAALEERRTVAKPLLDVQQP